MLLQLKLATKGFVSQHDEEEINYLKDPDLDELDDDEDELDEKETPETHSEEESDRDLDDDPEIFNHQEDINYSSDFFC